jgi:hypothetical protein
MPQIDPTLNYVLQSLIAALGALIFWQMKSIQQVLSVIQSQYARMDEKLSSNTVRVDQAHEQLREHSTRISTIDRRLSIHIARSAPPTSEESDG